MIAPDPLTQVLAPPIAFATQPLAVQIGELEPFDFESTEIGESQRLAFPA